MRVRLLSLLVLSVIAAVDQPQPGFDPALFQEWIAGWGDLVEFEIVPVTESKTTADLMRRLADAETIERP